MPESSTMTIRIESELKSRLDKLSMVTHRSKSFLAAEAVREYVDMNEWQIQEITAAFKEADTGDFATQADMVALKNKWRIDAD